MYELQVTESWAEPGNKTRVEHPLLLCFCCLIIVTVLTGSSWANNLITWYKCIFKIGCTLNLPNNHNVIFCVSTWSSSSSCISSSLDYSCTHMHGKFQSGYDTVSKSNDLYVKSSVWQTCTNMLPAVAEHLLFLQRVQSPICHVLILTKIKSTNQWYLQECMATRSTFKPLKVWSNQAQFLAILVTNI